MLPAVWKSANTEHSCTIVTGALAFAYIGARSLGSIIVVSVLYGIFSGGLVAIVPLLVVQLSPSRATIGNRMGMAFAVASIALLIGTPITGNLLNVHGFNAAFEFAGVCAVVGALTLGASRVCHGGWSIMKRL
jgi:MFS family permease